MHRLVRVLTVAAMAAGVVGFFLPWALIELREPALAKSLREVVDREGLLKDLGRVAVEIRRGTERITGELPDLADLPRQVSGFEIPWMANQPRAQLTMALLELLTNRRERLGAKSYAVYFVPGLAALCGLLLLALGRRRAVAVAVAVGCAAIAMLGGWKLCTTDTQALVVAITIGPGLWLSLAAYAGLALSAVLFAIAARPRA